MSIKLSRKIQWVVSEQCNLPEISIHTLALALSLPLSHTQRHIQGRNPYRLEDICNGNVLNREKPERSWKETNLFKRETNAAEKKDEYGLNLSNEEKIGIIGLVNM